MDSTTLSVGTPTQTQSGATQGLTCPTELIERYTAIIGRQRLNWTTHHRMLRLLGSGGQGVVYLSERRGTDFFTLPVALKVFSPQHYPDAQAYDDDMLRLAQIAARVAQIQQDNLLDVHNFIERNRIRIMEMEWIDGFDLKFLLSKEMLTRAEQRATPERRAYLNNVIVTSGPVQPRFKPGIAIQVVREVLHALTALHREGIVHGDIKPSNVMLKRTGAAKVIDIGSAIDLTNSPRRRMCSPAYAAPEVLQGQEVSPQSDLASLGYVLIEMLAGRPCFSEMKTFDELMDAKRTLSGRLPKMLPQEVVCNELLLNFCRRLVSPDPAKRFPSAEAANLDREGAANFHRQLINADLASEYENDIRVWLEVL